jgi:small subunit ribosomal protein S1
LSWGHVDHPSEVLAVGDEVTVQVLNVEQDRNRVSLGLKQCQPDPWKEAVKAFKPGEIVEGTITKIVPFGAFVSVADGVEGLIHISELADSRVEFPGDIVDVGQAVTIKVVDVELDRHRLSLSLKQAAPPKEASDDEEVAPVEEVAEVEEESATEKALRDIESVDRDIEAIDAAELTSPDLMADVADAIVEVAPVEVAPVEETPAEEAPVEEAIVEETPAEEAPVEEPVVENPAEPGTLEAILEEMKKESKS